MNCPGLGGVELVWAKAELVARAVPTRHAARCCFSMASSCSGFHPTRCWQGQGRGTVSTTWQIGWVTNRCEILSKNCTFPKLRQALLTHVIIFASMVVISGFLQMEKRPSAVSQCAEVSGRERARRRTRSTPVTAAMSGSTRTLGEGLNRSLASVRAVMPIPRDCETKQGTSPIYSTCQAVQPAKADPDADIRSHPLVSDPFSSRWPVPYFCPSRATLPGLTPGALGWLCGTAPTRPGDGLSPSLVRTSSPAGPVGP